jgi:hypothetical protein
MTKADDATAAVSAAMYRVHRANDESSSLLGEAEAAISAAKEKIRTAQGTVARLAVVFLPPRNPDEALFHSADAYVFALLAATSVAERGLVQPPLSRADAEQARAAVSYAAGAFAGHANREIWRRWFVKTRPLVSMRQRWVRRRQLELPGPQEDRANGEG